MEARDVFWSMDESHHVQLDYIRKLLQLNQDKEIVNKKELLTTLHDLGSDSLTYSNEMIVDMIIDIILKSTKNEELKEVLHNIFVMVGTKECVIKARAYPEYSDHSYFVEIGKSMYDLIFNLSDVVASIVLLLIHCKSKDEIIVGHKLLSANLLKLDVKDDSQTKRIDGLLYYHDDENFTDKYIAISREVFEVAISFLVGHEIGHHYYRHTSVEIKSMFENENIGAEINSPEDPRIKELIADKFAVGFTYEFLIANNHTHIHQGCGMYIPFLASALNSNPIVTYKKHPSMLLRILVLRENMAKIFDDYSNKKILLILNQLCDLLELIGKEFSWWKKNWMIYKGIPKEMD